MGSSFFFGRDNVKTSFVQTGKVALNTRKQSVISTVLGQRKRRSECIFLGNVWSHELYIGVNTVRMRCILVASL